MKIIKGKIPGAKKVVIYGPEGIGKSTLASKFPEPLFIDTEGSTKEMDVARTPAPSSWTMLMDQVSYIKKHPSVCRTLVIDTADWAELLCTEYICQKSQKDGIEDFGYGKGYTYLQEEFGRLLNQLEEVITNGIHVVMTAHAKMRKFEQPDEMGAYDRWEMKLTKLVSPIVKEWSDILLFANYKTYVINVDGQGAQKGKNKVQGGERVMYTTHHSCWDAKNRYGLPNQVPFSYSSIANIIEPENTGREKAAAEDQAQAAAAVEIGTSSGSIESAAEKVDRQVSGRNTAPGENPSTMREKAVQQEDSGQMTMNTSLPDTVPKPLRDLMTEYNVDEWDIQNVVTYRGYYPEGTPIENYDPDFVMGVLVGAWPQVYSAIEAMKKTEEIPF